MKTSAIAIAAIALASLATSASAATFLFSYQSGAGLLAGTIDGTLQGDNNTIFITSLSNLSFAGNPSTPLPFVDSSTNFYSGTGFPAATSIDGSFHDFIGCSNVLCDDGFVLTTGTFLFGEPAFASGLGYGAAMEPYNPQNWSLTSTGVVPEPASWAMLIAGFGLIGATMRRRRTALAA